MRNEWPCKSKPRPPRMRSPCGRNRSFTCLTQQPVCMPLLCCRACRSRHMASCRHCHVPQHTHATHTFLPGTELKLDGRGGAARHRCPCCSCRALMLHNEGCKRVGGTFLPGLTSMCRFSWPTMSAWPTAWASRRQRCWPTCRGGRPRRQFACSTSQSTPSFLQP